MAYTTDDLAKVRKAIINLASGERVTRFTTANGKTLTYAEADIDKLRSLEREIGAALQAQGRRQRSRTRQVITHKGL